MLVSPSTAVGGALGVLDAALGGLSGVRVVATTLPDTSAGCVVAIPNWAAVGVGRQDELLAQARVVVCGGGHGILVKALLAGAPAVVVPGGGDQRELAGRVARHGSALVVRPLHARALDVAVHRVLAEPSFAVAAGRAAESVGQLRAEPVQLCRDAAR